MFKVFPIYVAAPEEPVVVSVKRLEEAVVYTFPLASFERNPAPSEGRWNEPLKVDDAVENRPLRNPIIVEVETPYEVGVKGKVEPPEPQGLPTVVRRPPVLACTQFPEANDEIDRVLFTVEEAAIITPLAEPLIKFGKTKVSVRFVILQGTDVTAAAVIGKRSEAARSILNRFFI